MGTKAVSHPSISFHCAPDVTQAFMTNCGLLNTGGRCLDNRKYVMHYATLVCVLQEAPATLADDLIELHERILVSLFSREKRSKAEML